MGDTNANLRTYKGKWIVTQPSVQQRESNEARLIALDGHITSVKMIPLCTRGSAHVCSHLMYSNQRRRICTHTTELCSTFQK